MYVALSGGTLNICDVTTEQLSNGTVHKFLQNDKMSLFMKMHLPSSFIMYVRSEMNVHSFMIELDQKDYWYPRKF